MNINEGIARLCKRISGGDPIIVANQPEDWAKEDYCFANVKRKIEEQGGSGQFGWLFHWLPGILVAIHHQVWRSPEDKLICITPQNELLTVRQPDGIVFLQDDAATLDRPPGVEIGFHKPNIHLALTKNRRIRQVVRIARHREWEYGQQVQVMMKA